MQAAYGKTDPTLALTRSSMLRFFEPLSSSPIDRALMEPAAGDGKVVVIPMRDLVWSDVGTWPSLARLVDNHAQTVPAEVLKIMNEQLGRTE